MRRLIANDTGRVENHTPWSALLFKVSRLDLAVIRRSDRRRQWHPTPVLLPGESPWTEEPGGYSPWGRTESDTTEAT